MNEKALAHLEDHVTLQSVASLAEMESTRVVPEEWCSFSFFFVLFLVEEVGL